MRLVNKEFEEKVSEYLFRVVVVPFKPEIYGITPEPSLSGTSEDIANDALRGSVMLQDKGMRVFQGFGRRIRKFAMSFEFDQNKLANPPVKSDQEAITSFWGIYRWPFKKYNRYSQLEGLEQTADETRTMAKALRFIECAKQLGLSIDGGLGWLAGPDINQRVVDRGDRFAVFGESRFVAEPKFRSQAKGGRTSKSIGSDQGIDESPYTTTQRILQEAGYTGSALQSSLDMMLETDEYPRDLQRNSHLNNALNWQRFRTNIASPTMIDGSSFTATDADDSSTVASLNSDDDEENEIQPTIATSKGSKSKGDNYLLKPNDLTTAQKEMLLEVEWAQRAFMQSYAIAIIDNPFTFQHIQALTIARIPNRHLSILRREDFWDSLPQLNNLSLAIIPEWREVSKLATSFVEDKKVMPSASVSGVYQILKEQIGSRKNIKTLHLEWLCGGEEAPGLFARNQHILPAPLVENSRHMVNRAALPTLLFLPYVEHLSLKNCWVSPHVLSKFGASSKKAALQSLTLDSVSLTAFIPPNVTPNPLAGNGVNLHNAHNAANHAVANQMLLNFQGLVGHNAQGPPPPIHTLIANGQSSYLDWLQPPRVGSWADIIETLTPGKTLAEERYAREIGPEPPVRDYDNLTKLVFKSCGYVRLPLDFDQTALDPLDVPAPQVNAIAKKISDLDSFMMKPHDHTLGVIVNHISALEERTLVNGFLLTVGWDKSRAVLAGDAMVDGIAHPGRGRFDGVLTPNQDRLQSSSR